MSTTFAVPAALQEFLGHRQTKVEAFSVLALGVLLTVIYAALFLGLIGHANYVDSGIPTWRLVVGVLVVVLVIVVSFCCKSFFKLSDSDFKLFNSSND